MAQQQTDIPMNDKLKIIVDGMDVVLCAHELLALGIEVTKEKYEKVTNPDACHKIQRKTRRRGLPFQDSVRTIGNNPNKWLQVASTLQQGFSRQEILENQKILKQYGFEIKKKAIDFYTDKIKDLVKEGVNEKTKPVWDFCAKEIKLAVSELQVVGQKYKYDDLVEDAKRELIKINAYLNNIVCIRLGAEGLKGYKPTSQEELNKVDRFLGEIKNTYSSEVKKKVQKDFIYYLRIKLLKDLLTKENFIGLAKMYLVSVNETQNKDEIFSELEKTCKEGIFSKNNDEAIKACIELIATELEIPLAGEANYELIAFCLADYIKKIPSNVKIERQHIKDEIKVILLNNHQEKQAGYVDCLTREAASLVHKRRELYVLYNAIYFIRELDEQGKFRFSPKAIQKIDKYIDIANKLLNDKSISLFNITIQGPTKYYSFLKLLIKQGYQISSVNDLVMAGVLRDFQNPKKSNSHAFSDIDCCEYCNFAEQVLKEHPELNPKTIEEMKFEFFEVGSRVIAVENHQDRYAFDAGEAKKYFFEDLKKLRKLEKEIIQEIRSFFNEIYSNELENFNRNEFLGKLSIRIFSSEAYKKLFSLIEVKLQDIETIKKEKYDNVFDEYQSEFYALKKIEFEVCHYIENISRKLTTKLENESEGLINQELYEKNEIREGKKKEASYRGIFNNLPNIKSHEIATIIRSLLQGEKITYLEKNRILSLLTSAWFLSETSRNPMTLLVSLMLLDLIEAQLTYGNGVSFTWNRILWHPDTISNCHPDGTDLSALTSLERTKRYPQEDGWGGIHPMCHNGSYLNYFSTNKWPLSDVLEIVRQKEATLIIHWLYYMLQRYLPHLQPDMVGIIHKTKQESVKQRDDQFFFSSYRIQKSAAGTADNQEILIKLIKPLFIQRLEAFKNLYSLTVNPDSYFLNLNYEYTQYYSWAKNLSDTDKNDSDFICDLVNNQKIN